jgi:hypothetical protein
MSEKWLWLLSSLSRLAPLLATQVVVAWHFCLCMFRAQEMLAQWQHGWNREQSLVPYWDEAFSIGSGIGPKVCSRLS